MKMTNMRKSLLIKKKNMIALVIIFKKKIKPNSTKLKKKGQKAFKSITTIFVAVMRMKTLFYMKR